MVAQWVAIKYPERVDKIVLNTGILARPDAQGRKELEDLRARSLAVSGGPTLDAIRKRMEWLVLDPKSMPEEMIHVRYRIYTQPGVAARIRQIILKLMDIVLGEAGDRYFDPRVLRDLRCPTLSLWTDHNPGQGLEVARAASALIPDNRLHVIKQAAHWPQFEQPEEFNRVHLDFLRA
jgi:2-hydroxy-6-oxonona-2,4-dienedioate hydrolase